MSTVKQCPVCGVEKIYKRKNQDRFVCVNKHHFYETPAIIPYGKLPMEKVKEIRADLDKGISISETARRNDVQYKTAWNHSKYYELHKVFTKNKKPLA